MAHSSGVAAASRRTFLKRAALAATGTFALPGCGASIRSPGSSGGTTRTLVNDVHSNLNPTYVSGIARPTSGESLRRLIRGAARSGKPVSVCGGRHAGGGQQFLSDRLLIDLSELRRLIHFDATRGLVEVEAGIHWPRLIAELRQAQLKRPPGTVEWVIHQKQGGAEHLSIGGAVGSNIHGRGLNCRPIIQDIESLTLVDPHGELVRCSRKEHADRFGRAVGGYGLFGVIHTVTLRLVRRQKLTKRVRWVSVDEALATLESRAAAGAVHGDFQYSVDERSEEFMREGLVSWYEPSAADAPLRIHPPDKAVAQFKQLIDLAHRDKSTALRAYRGLMLGTDGQADWSDSWQIGDYVPGYHQAVDPPGGDPGSEVLSELYVPRASLRTFLTEAARAIKARNANLIYGTVRLIRRDDETFLPWAKQDYACVIFNLHTVLNPASIAQTAQVFRDLLDLAIAMGGSYYLTYHRFARTDQLLKCYPRMPEFLLEKLKVDPDETLQSDWYRCYRDAVGIG